VASGTSKSQLYQRFPEKSALVSAVIAHQAGGVLERDEGRLARFESFRGLERWRGAERLHRVTVRASSIRYVKGGWSALTARLEQRRKGAGRSCDRESAVPA
jgi:AcrR family transcriptional regulator